MRGAPFFFYVAFVIIAVDFCGQYSDPSPCPFEEVKPAAEPAPSYTFQGIGN
jgi:hypothetical protein